MNKKTTASAAGLSALVAPLAVSTPAHAAVNSAGDLVELIMENDAYFYGAVGACVLLVCMVIAGVASMGRRRRRLTIAAYDSELTRYRQELRRGI